MAEINDLTIVDASNVARFPENQAPSTVNNGARALEGLVARWHKDVNTSVLTTGTSTAYVYAANQTLSAYYDGMMLGVDFHTACGAAPTINVDAIGAKSLKWPNGTALAAGDVATGQKALLVYDGTDVIVLTAGGSAAAYDVGADAGEIAVNEQNWTAIASAATVNIGAAATERVNITGTTTITAFDTVTAGLDREIRFDGALTLTHNATSLILYGANITTAAGDVAKFVSEGSGNWRCVKYVKADGTPPLGGKVLQIVQTQTGAVATGTTAMVADDTIPQNTEGDEYMTLAITPKSASSRLRIDVVLHGMHTAGFTKMVALFRDSGADALATSAENSNAATPVTQISFSHDMASPGTSATTFKVRAGADSAGTFTFNGLSGSRVFGGVFASSIIITEYIA